MDNQKQFGVWMDGHHASVVGKETPEDESFTVLGHVKSEGVPQNSNEKNANNHEKTLETKFFKEIAAHLTNATHVHLTGTGQAQEKFIRYLADTPQFKNTTTEESTANKMSDEKLIEFISSKF